MSYLFNLERVRRTYVAYLRLQTRCSKRWQIICQSRASFATRSSRVAARVEQLPQPLSRHGVLWKICPEQEKLAYFSEWYVCSKSNAKPHFLYYLQPPQKVLGVATQDHDTEVQ